MMSPSPLPCAVPLSDFSVKPIERFRLLPSTIAAAVFERSAPAAVLPNVGKFGESEKGPPGLP